MQDDKQSSKNTPRTKGNKKKTMNMKYVIQHVNLSLYLPKTLTKRTISRNPQKS